MIPTVQLISKKIVKGMIPPKYLVLSMVEKSVKEMVPNRSIAF
jgi:hypothetical protein